MKVQLTVTIEVDRYDWDAEYGTGESAAEVRSDVREYFKNHIFGASAVEDARLTVRVA